jgi:small GTP-binding protein
MRRRSENLSDKHKAILYFIWQRLIENGYSPTMRELGEATKITSTSVVNYYLDQLEKWGYVQRDRKISRGYRLTDKAYALYGRPLKPSPDSILQLEKELNISIPQQFGGFNKEINGYWADLQGNIISLSVQNSKITTFPRPILKMESLTELAITYTQIANLPPEIENLNCLRLLSLENNWLTWLPKEIGQVRNLKVLRLSHNSLTVLPREISNLKELDSLELKKNPMVQPPPEIVQKGVKSILTYLAQLPDNPSEHNEAKLILVGDGEAGKSCLANRLVFDSFEATRRTEGIDVLRWNVFAPGPDHDEIKLNVWDFGGQEIYHSTHQFFLTKRSVYLLVWNERLPRSYEQIIYWLHTIEAHGGDSPIILVMTKCKEMNGDLNLADIKERFPQVVTLVKVDSGDETGIRELRELIINTVWKLPHMRTPWIDSWFRIRGRLEKDSHNWISYDKFQEICKSEGLDKVQMDVLDDYLHDLGAIIHFRQRGLNLLNIVILKSEWATSTVYKVLDAKLVKERDGILPHNSLEKIWKPDTYPISLHPKLLELMEAFDLAYEIPDRNCHLVPEHLPPVEPTYLWEDDGSLFFIYHYDFLPPGLITRFIVLIHRELELQTSGTQLCWHEGAVIRWSDGRALIKSKKVDNKIEIKVTGHNKRELLAIIRHEFEHIHLSMRKIEVNQLIPCNCQKDCKNVFNYSRLIQAERKGKVSVECQVSWDDVLLSTLLNGYELPNERQRYFRNEETTRIESSIINLNDHSTLVVGNRGSVDSSKGKKNMKTDKVVKIGSNAQVHAPVTISDQIENSYNNHRIADVDGSIHELLAQMNKSIDFIARHIAPENAELAGTLVHDAQTLSEEITSSSPRRDWYEVSIEGLIKAATNIGELAAPLLQILEKLRPLLIP